MVCLLCCFPTPKKASARLGKEPQDDKPWVVIFPSLEHSFLLVFLCITGQRVRPHERRTGAVHVPDPVVVADGSVMAQGSGDVQCAGHWQRGGSRAHEIHWQIVRVSRRGITFIWTLTVDFRHSAMANSSRFARSDATISWVKHFVFQEAFSYLVQSTMQGINKYKMDLQNTTTDTSYPGNMKSCNESKLLFGFLTRTLQVFGKKREWHAVGCLVTDTWAYDLVGRTIGDNSRATGTKDFRRVGKRSRWLPCFVT